MTQSWVEVLEEEKFEVFILFHVWLIPGIKVDLVEGFLVSFVWHPVQWSGSFLLQGQKILWSEAHVNAWVTCKCMDVVAPEELGIEVLIFQAILSRSLVDTPPCCGICLRRLTSSYLFSIKMLPGVWKPVSPAMLHGMPFRWVTSWASYS